MLRIKQHKFIWFGIILLGVILLGVPASVYAQDVSDTPAWVGSSDEAVDSNAAVDEGTEQLGDLYEDLVYTPVTPCKIVDTRIAGGALSAGQTRSYLVYGDTGAQGGSYCASPVGSPVAVHISMAAVTPSGGGVLKAFPSGDTSFRGLTVNFAPGRDLNNAGTVKTNYGAGGKIGVGAKYGGTHVTIQVLGYYKEPEVTKLQAYADSAYKTVSPGAFYAVYSPKCGTNYVATGGGCSTQFADARDGLEAVRPYPSSGTPIAWECRGYNRESKSINITAHVVCSRIPGR